MKKPRRFIFDKKRILLLGLFDIDSLLLGFSIELAKILKARFVSLVISF